MRQHQETLSIRPPGAGLREITAEIDRIVQVSGISTGLCHLFVKHTSASLLIQENADPSARRDLEAWFRRLVRDDDPGYTHTLEGPDDMSSHLKTALTSVSETIPIEGGHLALGTWQGVYLFEHRRAPSRREIVVHLIGS